MKLKPTSKGEKRKLGKALKRGLKGKATVSAEITNAVGSTAGRDLKVRLRPKR